MKLPMAIQVRGFQGPFGKGQGSADTCLCYLYNTIWQHEDYCTDEQHPMTSMECDVIKAGINIVVIDVCKKVNDIHFHLIRMLA